MAKSRAEFGSIKKNTFGKFVSRDWEVQWSQGQLETIEGGKMILFTNKISNSTYKSYKIECFKNYLGVGGEIFQTQFNVWLGESSHLAFIATTILNFGLTWAKFKIVVALIAKLCTYHPTISSVEN